MKRVFLAAISVAFLSAGLAAPALTSAIISTAAATPESQPAHLPSKKEFKAIIESAKQASELDTWQGEPFRLVGKVHYSLAGAEVDGMYEILWASKNQMRVNFKLGDSAEVYIVAPGKSYHWRTSLAIYLPMMTISSMVQFPLLIPHESTIGVHKVYAANRDGRDLFCGEIDDPLAAGEVCADATTSKIISMRVAAKSHREGDVWATSRFFASGSSFAASGIVPNAPAWYPARIERQIYDEHAIVEIVSFNSVKKFADGVFAPPKNATAYDWCAKPALVSDVDTNPDGAEELGLNSKQRSERNHYDDVLVGSVPAMRVTVPGELMAYYLVVGPDMRVTSVRALRANDPHSQKDLEENFSRLTFPVLSCQGNRISREAIFFPAIELVPRK